MGNLSHEFEETETVENFDPYCQETCNITNAGAPDLNLAELTEQPAVYQNMARQYWIPAPDEDPDSVFTCINCNLNMDIEGIYYECQNCFKCYCKGCYLNGIHSEHDDFICMDTFDNDIEFQSAESTSSCSTDENSSRSEFEIT